MMINIINSMSWFDSNSTTSTDIVNKEHENFDLSSKMEFLCNNFNDNNSICDDIRFIVIKSFHSRIIMVLG